MLVLKIYNRYIYGTLSGLGTKGIWSNNRQIINISFKLYQPNIMSWRLMSVYLGDGN
jgi:hypothetical protein